jgi:hypothetical protein
MMIVSIVNSFDKEELSQVSAVPGLLREENNKEVPYTKRLTKAPDRCS